MFTLLGLPLALLCSTVHAYPGNSNDNGNTTPEQVRLAYAGPTGMMVSWNTPNKVNRPTVRWGSSPWRLDRIATSDDSVTYQTSTTYNNHVKIQGLRPGQQYYYQIADGRNHYARDQQPLSFRTSRPAGDHSPFQVAVSPDLGTMGDLGLTTHVGTGAANPLKPGEINTIQSMNSMKNDWDFLWHVGDIAYADYWLKEEIQGFLPNTTIEEGAQVYEAILNAFYNEMTVMTAQKPYMVGPGNHEANCDNGGTKDKAHNISYTVSICMPGQTNFTGYRNHFRMPSTESGGLESFWYSFDHGMVHFIQLDTETDLGHGFISPDEPGGSGKENSGPFASYMNQQTDWLQKDLAAVDRSKTPWIVVGGHRPLYISVSGSICPQCQDVFEPYFMQYGVDLVISGHAHVYEREAPLYNNASDPAELNNPKFPWYITNGAAGHYDGLDVLDSPLQPYSRYAQDSAYGWSRLTFHNATHLTHEFVASGNGSVLDTATLYKDHQFGNSGGCGGHWGWGHHCGKKV